MACLPGQSSRCCITWARHPADCSKPVPALPANCRRNSLLFRPPAVSHRNRLVCMRGVCSPSVAEMASHTWLAILFVLTICNGKGLVRDKSLASLVLRKLVLLQASHDSCALQVLSQQFLTGPAREAPQGSALEWMWRGAGTAAAWSRARGALPCTCSTCNSTATLSQPTLAVSTGQSAARREARAAPCAVPACAAASCEALKLSRVTERSPDGHDELSTPEALVSDSQGTAGTPGLPDRLRSLAPSKAACLETAEEGSRDELASPFTTQSRGALEEQCRSEALAPGCHVAATISWGPLGQLNYVATDDAGPVEAADAQTTEQRAGGCHKAAIGSWATQVGPCWAATGAPSSPESLEAAHVRCAAALDGIAERHAACACVLVVTHGAHAASCSPARCL